MKEIEELLIKHRDSSYETGQEEYEEIILSRFSALSDKVKCLTVDYGLLKVDNHFNKTYLESAEILIAKLEAKVKELEGKDLYWRERVTELEHNENKFPTMAEFSNLQDDYESLKKQNAELKRQVEGLKKYRMFFESVSCLFAEGVEFMTKEEIYEAIKKETKQLEQQSDNLTRKEREG